jgi:inner membrane protein
MDNLSHSVVGLATAEFIHRSLPDEPDTERSSLRRRVLWVACWLASNFPDLDIVLTPLLPAPLGYLLHHRGHTHTLLYALPQAVLIGAVIGLCWPSARKLLKDDAVTRKGFVLCLCIGLGLHMLMDYLNSYGIHPFHPYDSRWFFGDLVFILEPLFWVAFGVPIAMMLHNRWLRSGLVALLIGAPLYFTVTGFLSWASFAALIVITLLFMVRQRTIGACGRGSLAVAALIGVGFVAIQGVTSVHVRHRVLQHLNSKDPESRVLDVAMTPFPTNPFCWTFVSIENNQNAGSYRLRRGLASAAPNALPVTRCPPSLSELPSQEKAAAAIALTFEYEGELHTLRSLKAANCHFEAWLRFARAPLLDQHHASDIRFFSRQRENFTTLNLEEFKHRECSRYVPKWDFPRADLLKSPS